MIFPVTDTMGLPYDVPVAEVYGHSHDKTRLNYTYGIVERWPVTNLQENGHYLKNYGFTSPLVLDRSFSNGIDAYLTSRNTMPLLVLVNRSRLTKLTLSRSDLAIRQLYKKLRAA
jgi:hypothetical protein